MRGFTLIELLLVTLLLALLLSLGVPALRTLQGTIATSVENYRLLSLLRVARTSATRAHRHTVLCPLVHTSGPACGATPGAGWLLFSDVNGDRRYTPADDEMLRLERVPVRRGLVIRDRRGATFTGRVTYRPDGSVLKPATLRLCAGAARYAVRVVVSMSGRVRTVKEEAPCFS